MSNQPPSNDEIASVLRPFYPLFSDLIQTAIERVRRGVPNLGLPRPVERASDMHRAIRECFRPICDHCPDWLELREEPEGIGMDFVIVSEQLSRRPFAVRWGRMKDGKISRNGSKRSVQSLATGYLFDCGFDEERNDLPMVTLAHTIEGDRTEVGVPQWWIGEIVLIRERIDASERIEVVDRFVEPERHKPHQYDAPLIRGRELDVQRWEIMLERLRGDAA